MNDPLTAPPNTNTELKGLEDGGSFRVDSVHDTLGCETTQYVANCDGPETSILLLTSEEACAAEAHREFFR